MGTMPQCFNPPPSPDSQTLLFSARLKHCAIRVCPPQLTTTRHPPPRTMLLSQTNTRTSLPATSGMRLAVLSKSFRSDYVYGGSTGNFAEVTGLEMVLESRKRTLPAKFPHIISHIHREKQVCWCLLACLFIYSFVNLLFGSCVNY